jgi:hypothetical protein
MFKNVTIGCVFVTIFCCVVPSAQGGFALCRLSLQVYVSTREAGIFFLGTNYNRLAKNNAA